MGLLSIFQRKDTPSSGDRKSAGPSADAVQQARTKARQRLIGAVVLLGIGIIGFPLLFESQPRPIPVDIPIEIPRKEGAPPLVLPAPRVAAAPAVASPPAAPASVITEKAEDAGREVPSTPVAVAPVAKPAASSPVPTPHKAAAEDKPKPKPAATATASTEDGARAKALLDGKTAATAAAKPASEAASGRFIVQVGAFAAADAAREARLKVEKLGLKTYTQVVETEAGKRIRVRVGPFASRDEAGKALAKLKSAGLPSNILSL
jgi:DedD protein